MKGTIGLIPGIIRDQMKQDRDAALKQVAQIGYQAVEAVTPGEGESPAELKKKLDDLGLKMLTVSIPRHEIDEKIDSRIELAKAMGSEIVACWWGPADSEDQVKQDAEMYNRAGEKAAAAGLKFSYHHHDHEFLTTYTKGRVIDLLMANTDPDKVYFHADTAWIAYGREDPTAFIRANAPRLAALHVKDIGDPGRRAVFCAVGAGVLDIQGSLEAAVARGVQWLVVEQDRHYNLTPMESITASYLNVKEMGLL